MRSLLKQARGEAKADLVFKNGRVLDVFNAELVATDVAVAAGRILGLGEYSGKEEVDLKGMILAPGYIDGHLHVESSMVSVDQFARRVIALGTTTVFADPHEVANVAGLAGIEWLLDQGNALPWNFNLLLPSCVPSSPHETAGAQLEAGDLEQLMDQPGVAGLGEVMSFPAVIQGDEAIWAKLDLFRHRFIDGHAPGVTGKDLNTYALGKIRADHEVTSPEEALEKVRAGLYVMIREGSAARNLAALLPAVNEKNFSRFLFATDDRDLGDLLSQGHIDWLLHQAVEHGMDPMDAIRLATINSAQCLGLNDVGAIAPGRRADLLVLEDLNSFRPLAVYKDGNCVARKGQALFPVSPGTSVPDRVAKSINIAPVTAQDFRLPAQGKYQVIRLIPGEIFTKADEATATELKDPTAHDLVTLAVVERHKKSGNIGLGLLRGLDLKKGALASSVAHDAHNIIVAGANSADMAAAVEAVVETQGGLVVVADGEILARLPLPLAGIMSPEPLEEVAKQLDQLERAAIALGVQIKSPFMALAFLALPVIPQLKLTDQGYIHL